MMQQVNTKLTFYIVPEKQKIKLFFRYFFNQQFCSKFSVLTL